ncbi:hypothetical protein SPONL_2079 [uncultured Candidatus Thioglobus sp.]|nr:hypothetical protein SPONL_2079 [uncultured Candidatus Thioglobus sp.]
MGSNLLLTFLIVSNFGLSMLGDFVLFLTATSILSLAYIALPANYSIFKIQDEESYLNYFNGNYIYSSILLIPIVFLVDLLNFLMIDGMTLYLYTAIVALQNYFDVFFQANNRLHKYYISILIISLLRLLLLMYVIYYGEIEFILEYLIDIYLFPTFFVLIILIYNERAACIQYKIIGLNKYLYYLKTNYHLLKIYYLGIIIKRLKDNMLILLFSIISSSELIGLYSLFVKIGSAILGQIRVLEAMLMNRFNLDGLKNITSIPFIVGFSTQLVIITIGTLYMVINTGEYYSVSLVIYSFIAYPYLKTIIMRAKMLSRYDNKSINKSYLFYIFLISIFFFIAAFFDINNINYILVALLLGEIVVAKTLSNMNRKIHA